MLKPADIGKIFIAKREQLHLTVDEVCAQTRIHPQVIEDLEKGVYDRLGRTYIKGFIKKYSDFLGLNTDDMVRKYESATEKIKHNELDLDAVVKVEKQKDKEQKKTVSIPEEKSKVDAMAKKESKLDLSAAPILGPKNSKSDSRQKKKKVKLKLPKIPEMPKVKIKFTKKQLQMAAAVVLSIVFIYMVFMFVGVVKTKLAENAKRRAEIKAAEIERLERIEREKQEEIKRKSKKKEAPVIKEKPKPKPKPKPEPKKEPVKAEEKNKNTVNLKLKALDRVWLQITDNTGKVIYVGILEKGETKTLTGEDYITVWSGKSEFLEFEVNSNNLGIVTQGVVKNIKVTPQGIKIGNEWTARID